MFNTHRFLILKTSMNIDIEVSTQNSLPPVHGARSVALYAN